MTNEKFPAPLWVLNQTEDHGLKVGMVIVELSNHPTLQYLDENGHFQPAVLNQIVQVLLMLRGGAATGGGMVNAGFVDKLPEFPVDEDLILLQFQKHYFNTTQTVCIPLNEKGEKGAAAFSDNMVTGKYFKEAKFLLKYAVNVVLTSNNITFALDGLGDSNIDEEEVAVVKSKIL